MRSFRAAQVVTQEDRDALRAKRVDDGCHTDCQTGAIPVSYTHLDGEGVFSEDAGLMNAPAALLEQHPGACYNARQSVPRPPGQHRLTD